MYLAHFGLREYPFSLTPDIVFAYQAKTHQEALNTLLLALEGGEGFVKVTGEVGTGKTLLCRTLLDRLGGPGGPYGPGGAGGDTVTAYVPNPRLRPHQMLRHVALELGLRVRQLREEPDLYHAVEHKLLALADLGKRVVLCVDEAQALPVDTLESLRLLSNLETGKHKLIQIVLFGQPELNGMLQRKALRSLASRIAFSARLAPLSAGDLSSYLRHRLSVGGWAGPDLFSAAANRLLWLGSGGVPRRANALAHKALLLAFGEGHRQVGATLAWRAWRDEESLPRAVRSMFASVLRELGGALFGRAAMGAMS